VLAGRRVLLGVTGGVAAYKAALVARALRAEGADVTVVMTEAATRFVGPETFAALTGRPVHTSLWDRPGDVLHVRLAREADVALVAPATANAIARLAHGIADDLLTSTLLEATCPLVLAPAMHTGMWEHPATRGNLELLRVRGVRFVGPVSGPLAAGDEGPGRLAEPEDIVAAVRAAVSGGSGDLAGTRVVVTAGPTHEPIDPVRFIGNRSSGKMGMAIASEASRRGAAVTLVLGPGTVAAPSGVELVRVDTADEMRAAVEAAVQGADALVMAAAVADFRPVAAADDKLKKDAGVPEVRLERTADILAGLAGRDDLIRVGFAAETTEVEGAGRDKLAAKRLDLLVANEVGRAGTGFGSDTNRAAILAADGRDVPMRTWTKTELAGILCDRVAGLLEGRGRSAGYTPAP
jgi:phosphopantothenoylcysteine decarboxylase / phosphopantothenate---cysteine ligase